MAHAPAHGVALGRLLGWRKLVGKMTGKIGRVKKALTLAGSASLINNVSAALLLPAQHENGDGQQCQ